MSVKEKCNVKTVLQAKCKEKRRKKINSSVDLMHLFHD